MTPTPSADVCETVTIADVTYQLKFGAIAEFVASDLGVTISSFLQDRGSPRAFADYMKLFSAMVAHHFQRLKQPIPTPRDWAAAVEAAGTREQQLELTGEIVSAVSHTLFPNLKATAKITLTEKAPKPSPDPSPVN